MNTWFNSRRWGRRPAAAPGQPLQATIVAKSDLDAAYRRGRRDEAKRHRGSPFLAFLGLIAVAAIALVIYLAVQTGSFTNGGAVVDSNLQNASQTVQAPVKRAEDKAGAALENAGQNLKQSAGDTPSKSTP